ncbi:CRISPR-associated endonuclease Cas1 [uncultured Aliiroseovarius sp.]|uniref:CRISPR-associated endonuclease Cas1 n=1 Tax=uncultured Aliiroseovarius sp. TaxID=1658783 RepID=UPI002630210F|nr:CRISPR-associated endonuclease Cas1 [uncultured Aliiroseovarius sp.]
MFAFRWFLAKEDHTEEIEEIVADEPRLPLHILAHDAALSVDNGMLEIDSEDECRRVRLDEISLVALHGGSRITVPCLNMLVQNSVPLILHSRNGYYRGQLLDLSASHGAVRRAQYAAAADERMVLALSKGLIEGKLLNTARVAKRRLGARSRIARALIKASRSARKCRTLSSLRGVEGAAAAAWYGAWPEFLSDSDEIFVFSGRNRRPAQDATNALLSYLYAVVAGTASAASASAGFDPNVGFFHAERPGRPALALDLVEPLRPAVVDTAVIAAIRNREFSDASFVTQSDGSVRLSDEGRRRALDILERRLSTTFRYDGTEMTWRAAISHHAVLMAKALREGSTSLPLLLPR